ncbi:MAG: DUF3592 domain-containing protein [Gloeomargarita sp. DG02_5_bins_242]
MGFLIILLILAPLVVVGFIIVNSIRLMRNFLQVVADGIETNAVIVSKQQWGRRYDWVTYEYRDQEGQVHRNGFDAFRSAETHYQVGDTLRIVYSASRPHLSSTQALVQQVKQAQK